MAASREFALAAVTALLCASLAPAALAQGGFAAPAHVAAPAGGQYPAPVAAPGAGAPQAAPAWNAPAAPGPAAAAPAAWGAAQAPAAAAPFAPAVPAGAGAGAVPSYGLPGSFTFKAADLNGDGCVDPSEFELWERAVGLAAQGADAVDSEVDSLKAPAMLFWGAFFNSIAMIIVTELGDKTFFIAAVMAMQFDRMPVFTGAIAALAVMTVLSAGIGYALPALLPRTYTHYAATLLFFYFGFKLLKEGWAMADGVSEELEEVEQELGVSEDVESGKGKGVGAVRQRRTNWSIMSQVFMLTFLAEWGDRSQIATIALATSKDVVGVTLGGVLGHSLCTGLAVLGGKALSTRISERQVFLAGGVLFMLFGLHSLWAGP